MNADQAKKAAAAAVAFFKTMHTSNVSDVRVEEIELCDASGEWHITIGFARPVPGYSPQAKLAQYVDGYAPMERDYKRIDVRADDFEVVRMAIREVVS